MGSSTSGVSGRRIIGPDAVTCQPSARSLRRSCDDAALDAEPTAVATSGTLSRCGVNKNKVRKVAATELAPPTTPLPDKNDVWAEVRGTTFHGTYSVADGWVEVIADNGLTKTAQIRDSSEYDVAERLLFELYRRNSGAFDD